MNFKNIVKFSLLEIALVEIIFFAAVWLFDDYLAILLTVIISSIAFSILIISLVVEAIERSKISKKYFIGLFTISVVPLIVGISFYYLLNGINFKTW